MAGFAAGIPYTAALNTINRQCSSSLAAINQIANQISTGQIDIGIGAGAESMSMFYGKGMFSGGYSEKVRIMTRRENI